METDNRSREELLAENKELRYRLEEAEETLYALGSGAADALVVSMPEGGERVFTLQGADHPYRVLIETMNEGAATLTSDGTILYCNKSMAALLQVPLEKLIGSVLLSYVAPADSALFAARLESCMRQPAKGEISLLSGVGNPTPVLFSCYSVELPGSRGMNVLFTDITELKQAETQLQIAAERERAAAALLEIQERLALAADAGQVGMFDFDMESGDVRWTQQQEKIFGYEPTTTTTTTTTTYTYQEWADRVHPDDLPMVEERMRQAMEERDPFQVEYRVVWPNGSVHWVNVASKYYFDDSGRCTRLMGAVRDISEYKHARAVNRKLTNIIQHEKDRLSAVINGITDEVWFADTQKKITLANPSTLRFFGLDVTDKIDIEKFAASLEVFRPDGSPRPIEEAPPLRALRGETVTNQEEIIRNPVTGELRYRDVNANSVRDIHGNILGSVSVVRDITDRKRAEEALRESEQRFRIMADRLPMMIWVHDAQGKLLFVNQTYLEFFGVTPQQVAGPNWQSLVHSDDAAAYAVEFSACVRDRRHFHAEVRARRFDGEWRWIESHGQPRFSASGEFLGMVGTSPDITERKQAEDRLKASLQEKEVLLKEIHHRVKNNMQVISSMVNLQADNIDNPDVQVHLQDIRDRVRSMALVHEKLYQADNLSSVPFDEYVVSLLSYLRDAYCNTGATIKFTTNLQPVSLWVEKAVPCGLMLNELVSNAFKHAFMNRTSGEISTVLHRNPEGTICLSVSDDGVGMPPELDWRKSKSLGLRLIDILSKQLNATVELNREKGTEFKITFKTQEKDGGMEHSHG